MSKGLQSSRPIRMKDIAEMAGVHVTAVSAVLSARSNTRTQVSEKTKTRILQLAKQFNYRPHVYAQLMRKQKTGLIAIITFGNSEISTKRTDDAAYAVRTRGYRAIITNILWHHKNVDGIGLQEAFNSVRDAKVEGVVLVMPTVNVDPHYVHEIQNAGIPCVSFDGVYFPRISQVRTDFAGGAKKLTDHLLQLGHKRLILLSSWGTANRDRNSNWPILERMEGFKSSIQKAGGIVVNGIDSLKNLPEMDIPVGVTMIQEPIDWRNETDQSVGYHRTKRLLQAKILPDALFCSNDLYALGALRACFEAKIRVPEELAIVGLAGEKYGEFLTPSLTTANTLNPAAGEAALDMLVEMIEDKRSLKKGTIIKKPCPLIIRESCGSKMSQKKPKRLLKNKKP